MCGMHELQLSIFMAALQGGTVFFCSINKAAASHHNAALQGEGALFF